jgi:hypothetical protein
MRSEDLDPCPTLLVMSYEMKTPGTSDGHWAVAWAVA